MTACNGPAICEINRWCNRKEINSVRNRSVIYHVKIIRQLLFAPTMEQTYLKLQNPDKEHTSTRLPTTAEHFLNMIQVYLWYSHALRYSRQTLGISLEVYKTVNKSHITLKTSAFYVPLYKRKTLQDPLFVL